MNLGKKVPIPGAVALAQDQLQGKVTSVGVINPTECGFIFLLSGFRDQTVSRLNIVTSISFRINRLDYLYVLFE